MEIVTIATKIAIDIAKKTLILVKRDKFDLYLNMSYFVVFEQLATSF